MKKFSVSLLLAFACVVVAVPANAACEFVSGPCTKDSYGNTYRTEQNFGGGYNTYRNGILDSQTSQNLSGGYTTKRRNGLQERRNYNPYAKSGSQKRNGLQGYR